MNNAIIIKEKSAKCDRDKETKERNRVGMRTNIKREKNEVATIYKKMSRRKDRKKTIW